MSAQVISLFKHQARTSAGQRSGRSSDRETPVSFSIDSTNSAGTPRLERVSQYQTCDCVVPIRSAKGFCPPAAAQARFSASVFDMAEPYPHLGRNQPRNLWRTNHLNIGSFTGMKKVDQKALGNRVRTRRDGLGLSGKALGEACGMSQQGVDNIEQGKVARPRNLLELAAALFTTPQWLLYGEGPEEFRPPNARDELLSVAQSLDPDQIGAALEYLRRLREAKSEVA